MLLHHFGQNKGERQKREDFVPCIVQPRRRVGGDQGREDLARRHPGERSGDRGQ